MSRDKFHVIILIRTALDMIQRRPYITSSFGISAWWLLMAGEGYAEHEHDDIVTSDQLQPYLVNVIHSISRRGVRQL